MLIYFLIFISKILENALSTLRLIVVSNGKKKLGALLQGVVAIIWILVTGVVIVDINKDVFRIISFCLGSIVGSYLGSFIEEKIAMGNNVLTCVIDINTINLIKEKLNNYKIIVVNEIENDLTIIYIILKRKEINTITSIIKDIDKNSIIISEKVKVLNNIV